jgi:hypothetical protein
MARRLSATERCDMLVNLWEIIHTVPGQEEPYMTSVLAASDRGRQSRGEPVDADRYPMQVGLFRTAEVSGTWPKVINLWGPREWRQLVSDLKRQFTDARDVDMEDWWNRNLTLRKGGFDRVLVPAGFSPDPGQLQRARTKGRVFLHDLAKLPWGEAPNYLARLEREFLPAAERHGWQLIGAYLVAMRPREVLTVWGMREWQVLADLLAAAETEPDLAEWFAYRAQVLTENEELVLIPGRINPFYSAD